MFVFFVCAASKDALYFFESFTLFIFIQLLPGSASWKPSKESASKHESPTHLRKHVKAGKEGDCFDAKMRIPLACSRNGLTVNYFEAGESIKGNSLSRNKTINGISR